MLTAKGSEQGCFRIRGEPTHVLVCVDDAYAPGGMNDLTIYRPLELDRVEIYGGGREIRLYTAWFMNRLTKHKYRPQPRIPGVC